jgi:hypothetical protein
MQSLVPRNRRAVLWSVTVAATLVMDSAHALNQSVLWLPRAQSELKPLLIEAAQLAESSDECEEVISGEQDMERSTEAAPVFRIVCRNPAGYTYSVYVTDAGKPDATVEKVQGSAGSKTAAGSASSSKTSKGTAGTVDDRTARQNCLASLKIRTERMTGVQLDASNLQRLASATGVMQYEMDFDAADPSGMALHFHAMCRVSASGTPLVEVRPRRVVNDKPAAKSPAAATTREHEEEASKPASTAGKQTEPAPDDDDGRAKSVDEEGWEVVE